MASPKTWYFTISCNKQKDIPRTKGIISLFIVKIAFVNASKRFLRSEICHKSSGETPEGEF